MEIIPKSGYYYPNRFARITLLALEEVMGKNGLNAILNMGNLPELIENYPPANLEREFDFAQYSMLNLALEEMYGPHGGRGLALRAGRATFKDALRNFGAIAGVSTLAFKVLPLNQKLSIGLPAMAKIFTTVSDQHSTVEDHDTELHYVIHRCPVCWGRTEETRPVCYIATGLIQESLKWVSGGHEFKVEETECIAKGDDVCRFVVQKQPLN